MENREIPTKDVYVEMDELEPKKDGRFWQIDFLKVFAMLLVIMDHSTTHDELRTIGSPLWERIAIPIFMIVLGFNWAKSLQKHKHLPYRKLFSWRNYWKNKFVHFLLPYGVLYVLSFGLNFIINRTQNVGIYGHPKMRFLLFPWTYGPGSWFIMALFLTILVFPLVFMIFDKIPIVGLVLSFGVEIGWQFLMKGILESYYENPTVEGYILFFSTLCTPFILMSAIGMGVWLSQNHKIFSWRNIIIWILGICSLFYTYVYAVTPAPFLFNMDWSLFLINLATRLDNWALTDYHLFHFPYSALIVMIVINILPRNPKGSFARFITLISKSTFHILMVQIFYFSILYNQFLPMFDEPAIWASVFPDVELVNLMFWPLNVVVTFGLGILWYRLESNIFRKNRIKKDKEILKRAKARGWIQ